uniref:DUF1725 domain-containing protein n=1 Tax=Sus scrofa TaxID=9823 RepID=A0A8D0XM21_PIG
AESIFLAFSFHSKGTLLKKGTLLHCGWKCKLVQPLWKTVWRLLKKLNIELSCDLSNPTPRHISGENFNSKDTCTPIFIAALFIIAKTWKQSKCPSTEEWIKKMFIYTMEYYSAIKKNEIMPFAATWVDLKIVILNEVSQTEKDKYHMISLTCGI